MHRIKRIQSKYVLVFLIFLFASLIFVSKSKIVYLYSLFPLIGIERDWLGIAADIVQSLGFITLVP